MRIRGLEMLVFPENFAYALSGWPLSNISNSNDLFIVFLRTSSYKAIWGCLFCFIPSLRYKVKIMNITLSCAIWKIITTLTDLISFCVATDSIWEHTKKEKLKLVHWFWKWPVFTHISSVIRRKSESQNGCLRKETAPNFQKNQHFYILIRTLRCAY